MAVVTVIDYGTGNLLSVSRAIEYCGAKALVSSDPEQIIKAECVILPGVGAFADGMKGLESHNLINAIKEFVNTERPFLGICLGMQMMLDYSEEFGFHEGMGLIPGKVEAIPDRGTDGKVHSIPYIGWNEIYATKDVTWHKTVLEDIPQGTSFYFVHSYTPMPIREVNRLADSDYNGRRISAVIRNNNMYGCQFHPEKSGPMGLQFLSNFIRLLKE